jgi:hypothetical protein
VDSAGLDYQVNARIIGVEIPEGRRPAPSRRWNACLRCRRPLVIVGVSPTCAKNAEGKRTTVPFHAGKTLHPRLLGAILKDAGPTPEQFQELMK